MPPVAKQVPSVRTFHGDTFIDQYEWLRDRSNPEVVAHLDAENAYTEEQTSGQAALREELVAEFRARTTEDDLSVPTRIGQWWYYSRTVDGKPYELRCRRPAVDWTPPSDSDSGDEEILLDCNAEASGTTFFEIGVFEVSPDGSTLAYSVDTVGDERFTLKLKDIGTGATTDVASDTAPSATWSPDGEYLFYVTLDESWREDTVWRHRIGSDSDVAVYHEVDAAFDVSVSTSRSGAYLQILSSSQITSESLVLDASQPSGEFQVVLPRRHGVEYSVEHAVIDGKSRFLFLHNESVDGWGTGSARAENFLLAQAPVEDPLNQTTVVPHREDVTLSRVAAFAGHVTLLYRRATTMRLAVGRGLGEFRELEFEEDIYVLRTMRSVRNPEWDQPYFRFMYSSYLTPHSIYDYDFSSGELLLRKVDSVDGYDRTQYVQKRSWATAADGTQVPISVVSRHDLPEGPAPTTLLGYGSYGASAEPYFNPCRISLLDRGIVFAVAHVRGGAEMGRGWYEDGKTLTKKNTFTDYIAVAEHLIDSGFTAPDRLVATGGQCRRLARRCCSEHGTRIVLWNSRRRSLRRSAHLDARPVAPDDSERMGRVE